MFDGPNKFPKRKSTEQPQPQAQRAQLIDQIMKMQDSLSSMNRRLQQQAYRRQKMIDSNMRNQKRLLRYRARIEEMMRHKDSPEHLLAISGYMNQSVQEYILSHNYAFSANSHEMPDPDHMTYEQLIELGDRLGKVSRGLTKEQISSLPRQRNKSTGQKCPICQCQFQAQQWQVQLFCRHCYHQQCISSWFSSQNSCPICKQPALQKSMKKQQYF